MANLEHGDVAEMLKKTYTFKTPNDSNIVYVYNNGYYIDGRLLIDIETQKIMQKSGIS